MSEKLAAQSIFRNKATNVIILVVRTEREEKERAYKDEFGQPDVSSPNQISVGLVSVR